MTVTYRMVDDSVYLASWEYEGQNHVFLFNDPISIERAREMIKSVGIINWGIYCTIFLIVISL